MELGPNEDSPYHVHKLDYVIVYVTPSRIAYMAQPGRVDEIREYGDGYVRYTAVGAGISHQIRNVGEGQHRQILVELKSAHADALSGNNDRVSGPESRP